MSPFIIIFFTSDFLSIFFIASTTLLNVTATEISQEALSFNVKKPQRNYKEIKLNGRKINS